MKELRLIPVLILIPLLLFISLTTYAYGGGSYGEDSTENIPEEECAYIAGTWDYHLTCTWGDCSWLTKPNGTIDIEQADCSLSGILTDGEGEKWGIRGTIADIEVSIEIVDALPPFDPDTDYNPGGGMDVIVIDSTHMSGTWYGVENEVGGDINLVRR